MRSTNLFLFRRSELVSILAALVMLLRIGVFSALDWHDYLQNRKEVRAARQVSEHISALLIAATEAQAG
jgi:hypothetical protein